MSLKQKNPFVELWEQLPAPIRNKYFIVLVLFFGWMIFFDKSGPWTQYKLWAGIQDLEEKMDYYEAGIEEAEAKQKDLEENRERFAREEYYLQKENEDVFIIEDLREE